MDETNNEGVKVEYFLSDYAGNTANQLFGEWLEEHPTTKIVDFKQTIDFIRIMHVDDRKG